MYAMLRARGPRAVLEKRMMGHYDSRKAGDVRGRS
jgi:hypothetical protein